MKSKVSLVKGENRKDNLKKSLELIKQYILDKARGKRILIKPNFVFDNVQLAASHVESAEAVIEFFQENGFKDIIIAESSAQNTLRAFKNYGYLELEEKYAVKLLDLNKEGSEKIKLFFDGEELSVRVAKKFLEDYFIVSLAKMKTHDTVVATLSIKNILMGAPLKTLLFNDKSKMHQGIKEINGYLGSMAEKIFPDLAVIDGFVGMEGNGPVHGTPVKSEIAISSVDALAADFVALKCMSINPNDIGYLSYIAEKALGSYKMESIEVLGDKIEECIKKYGFHNTINKQLRWRD